MSEPESVKVVLLGESGVGKTSIINLFLDKNFNQHEKTSLSAKFTSRVMEFPDLNQSIKFDIWDTVGQEKYRSLTKIFYKSAKIIIFVYDIISDRNFEELKAYWYHEAKNSCDGSPVFAVVANKIDLYEEAKVTDEEGKKFADEIGAIFQKTSALSNQGIDILFKNIGKKYLNPNFNYEETDTKAKQEYMKKKNEKNKQNSKNAKNNTVKLKKEESEQEKKEKKCC